MESLALLVAIIFLIVAFSGIISLILSYLDFYYLSIILGIFAIISGLFWTFSTPIPICFIGTISAFCGIISLDKTIN